MIRRWLATLWWLSRPCPTVDPEEHYGLRFTTYTPTAPCATEEDLLS